MLDARAQVVSFTHTDLIAQKFEAKTHCCCSHVVSSSSSFPSPSFPSPSFSSPFFSWEHPTTKGSGHKKFAHPFKIQVFPWFPSRSTNSWNKLHGPYRYFSVPLISTCNSLAWAENVLPGFLTLGAPIANPAHCLGQTACLLLILVKPDLIVVVHFCVYMKLLHQASDVPWGTSAA